MHSAILNEVRYAYDERNSVIIDRLADMGRDDRRTADGASPLVLAIEQFLNNFSVYIQDKRKVVPDINYVIRNIKDASDQQTYAARLLHALTSLSGMWFGKPPSDAVRLMPQSEDYWAVANAVLDMFPTDGTRERVLLLYRRRLEEVAKSLKARQNEVEEEVGGFFD